ncbi:MAG: lipopolysaccharide heptosyltransferase II, partial [Candidatus Omnitrophica bacterium]|nr:lipopolysaccharide heptosyltransferase II [Candidatus Omnitrophota bacterium]
MEKNRKKKILVINVNWLGDVIFSTPALRALREQFPQAHIACLVVAQCEEVLKNNPRINEIIVYDEYGKHHSLWGKIRFIRYLRKKHFDEVYVLHPSLRRAMIGFLAGIPRRIGYGTKNREFLLTEVIPAPDVTMHKIDYFLNLVKAGAINDRSRECEFFINADDEKKGAALLRESGIGEKESFVLLNPGGNWDMKRWPANNFSVLADMIRERTAARVIVGGAKKDLPLAREIAGAMKMPPVLLTGKTNLQQLAAVMKRAACVVTGDSGPMHIAAAIGANAVALFGPTSPQYSG